MARDKFYRAWDNMKQRCKKNKLYLDKGITYTKRWEKFENFKNDMFETWVEGLTLDRIDNDGNYEPNNCRWATACTQMRNTRRISKRNTSGYRGVRSSVKKNGITTLWKAVIVVNKKEIYLGTFKNPKDGGIAYDSYIKENNLEHTTNGLIVKSCL